MDLNLYDCPHCNTPGVLPTDDGLCPNCKKAIDLAEDRSVNTAIVAKETPNVAKETPNGEGFMECKNHQGVQALDRCADCMESFCANCLIEILGERYCHRCNAMMIQENVTIVCKEASDALKFAIVGVLIIGIILEPIAILKALKAKKMINTNPRLTGSGKATAALIIAIIYLLLITIFISVFYLNTAAVLKSATASDSCHRQGHLTVLSWNLAGSVKIFDNTYNSIKVVYVPPTGQNRTE